VSVIWFTFSAPGICPTLAALPEDVAAELAAASSGAAGDCDPRSKYPIARPATRHVNAIP
jgi:hypothetical protein